jgi:hypothetical protein
MKRTGKLASLWAVVVLLLLLVTMSVTADQGAPVGITDTPTPTATPGEPPPVTPPVVPEASTLVLLGGSATGLAAYIGLQIRARRRDS